MSHEHAGAYAKKHESRTKINDLAEKLIKERAREGSLSCAEDHKIAAEAGTSPMEVGKALDLMEIRIIKCQLGFFGYGGPERSIVKPASSVGPVLGEKLDLAAEKNRISCKALWEIGDQEKISKIDVASACEALKLKVCACQLGTF